MKCHTLSVVLAFFTCLIQVYGQKPAPKCVPCTPCGEQHGLERLPMQKIASGDGDEWAYVEGGYAWESVLFMTSGRNVIQSESSSPKNIYIIELISSDIGAQPEYYWIDAAQTDLCEIAALEHPRRSYHHFNMLIYRQST